MEIIIVVIIIIIIITIIIIILFNFKNMYIVKRNIWTIQYYDIKNCINHKIITISQIHSLGFWYLYLYLYLYLLHTV